MKRILQIMLAAMLCAPAFAVAVAPATIPHVTFVDASGGPCAGCKLQSFLAGTTTPTPTFTDSTGVSQNTNPIILDAAGGANIWLSNLSYKLILKDATGTIIWTVDNVKGGGGLGGICGPAGAIQVANSAVNGLTCDATITINTVAHTLNVGTLTGPHVTIGAFSTPTAWSFDTASAATALASLGGTTDGAGTSTPGLLAISTTTAHALGYTSVIPTGTTAATQAPSNASTLLATTAYVANPGGISPTALSLAGGSPFSGNQGTGVLIQHSTGATGAGHAAVFDVNGNVVDGGAVTNRVCNSNGCYRIEQDGTIEQWGVASGCASSGSTPCTVTVTFPVAFTSGGNISVTSTCNAFNCISSILSTSTSSFVQQYVGASNPGGGGGNMTGSQNALWYAIGF